MSYGDLVREQASGWSCCEPRRRGYGGQETKRTCSRCHRSKPLSEFYKNKGASHRWECKECFKALMRPRSRAHYTKNRPYYLKRNAAKRKFLSAFVQQYKETHPLCADCKLPHPPWRLDFDHLDPSKKVIEVSMISRRGWSVASVLEEIAKCELVCANCHRDRTYARRTSAL